MTQENTQQIDFLNITGKNIANSAQNNAQNGAENKVRDVIIIGSGPAGYTAAIYLGRAGYKPLVIAGALTPGGQLVNTTEVENYPGFPDGVMGPDLMDSMQKQAKKFRAEIVFDDVVSVDFGDRSNAGAMKRVTCDQGDVYQAPAIVVTTGSNVRKLGVPGEKEYSGKGVSYCATCDGFFFRGKPIVVVGGGDSAFTDAEFLTRFGSSVTLIHRRSEFRAAKIMVDRAKANDKMSFILDSVVDKVNGEDGSAKSVTVRNVKTGETTEVPASGVFVAIGNTPATGFLGGILKLDEKGYIEVDGASTRTSVPGVFAAGDVVDSVYRQAVSAAGMGCRAALDAQEYLDGLK
ncbi:thioredoxin-disulfide reductase [Bifidobacterium sp. ESL0784]|uniref:thioredoxin-disulfide reductase n=1 Tax=Bifidobacterium sp. ESL0784 TaxID=2983231 RepID=UPI0023F62F0C|nr:thioredoxin-disulfide reductase [Bifidobacterium sp. ESL0784]MDF7640003.1 thioredoxin-disulfide reductase [Bifidobacterium sp. ESL0784]